ncbi:MAG: zinc ribbon domain-containing protein, partial [Bifidobacteriaceae bacterium]|nr:zinc ribbon domain-containing protein [Bifidobacteriaceae bacterium]
MAEPQPAQTNQPAGPAAPSPSLAEADAAPRCARCGNVLNPGFGFCTVCGAIPGKSDMEAPAQAGPISMSYEPPARPAGPIAAMPPRASLLEPKPVDSHAVNPMVFASVLL